MTSSPPGGAGRSERPEAPRTGDGQPPPARPGAEVARECRRPALVDEMPEGLEREREAASDGRAPRQAAPLGGLRGIGPTSARLLAEGVLRRDFASRRRVAACPGPEPSPRRSGQRNHGRGAGKAGSRRARRAAAELARPWPRRQPDGGPSPWLKERAGAAEGRARRIAAAAPARKPIAAPWRHLASGTVPEGASMRA